MYNNHQLMLNNVDGLINLLKYIIVWKYTTL